MRISTLTSSLLLAPALLFVAPRADQVAFHPKEGSTLAKSFSVEADFELQDVSFSVDGRDVGSQMPTDVSLGGKMHWQISDQYVKLEENAVRELVREFKKSTGEWSADAAGQSESGTKDDVSDLDGTKVRFKWNADEKHFDVSFAEGDADEKKLEHLDWDADYTELLPHKAVSEGDRWDVDAKGLGKVLFPGTSFEKFGDLDADGEAAEMFEVMKSSLLPQLEKLIGGLQTKCTYGGQREADGVQCGVITVEVSLDESLDLSEMITKAMETQVPQGIEIKSTIDEASLAVKSTGKGELLWDLASGHAHAFTLDNEMKLEMTLTMSVDAGGESHDIDGSASFDGTTTWKMSVE